MVSQTEADPGYPPGLMPCLGRLPDGEIFAALVWSNKLSVMGSMVWPDKINADTGSLKKSAECLLPTLDSGLILLLCHHPDHINHNRH